MCATRHFTPRSFSDGLGALRTAGDVDALRALLPSLCASLGQRFFRYCGRFPLPDGSVATPRLDNLLPDWRQRYEQHYEAIDPALARAARQLTPVEWTAGLYTSPEALCLLDEQRAAGLRFGVTYPVFTPSGALGTLSLSSPRRSPLRRHARRLCDTVATGAQVWRQHAGVVLATHLHEAVWRVVQRDTAARANHRAAPALTPRERECLRWVARGKTSWEIGRILTLSEHGVVFHLRSVMRKFGVSSRHRAAKLASDYGLLDDTATPPLPNITCVSPDRQASCSVST
jgi:LuxR family quorum-sensing transcriptional regulator LasR